MSEVIYKVFSSDRDWYIGTEIIKAIEARDKSKGSMARERKIEVWFAGEKRGTLK